MHLLIDYATAEGLKSLCGQVLTENITMLAMCRELGFKVKADPNDAGIALVSLDLASRLETEQPAEARGLYERGAERLRVAERVPELPDAAEPRPLRGRRLEAADASQRKRQDNDRSSRRRRKRRSLP